MRLDSDWTHVRRALWPLDQCLPFEHVILAYGPGCECIVNRIGHEIAILLHESVVSTLSRYVSPLLLASPRFSPLPHSPPHC